MSNRTFVLIKPDGTDRKLIGEIISRFERKGLAIDQIKIIFPPQELVEKHYLEHREKDFYPRIIKHLSGNRCVAMIVSNPDRVMLCTLFAT